MCFLQITGWKDSYWPQYNCIALSPLLSYKKIYSNTLISLFPEKRSILKFGIWTGVCNSEGCLCQLCETALNLNDRMNVASVCVTQAEKLWALTAFQSAPWNMQLHLKWMGFLEAVFPIFNAAYRGTLYHIHPAYHIHMAQHNHWRKNRGKIAED